MYSYPHHGPSRQNDMSPYYNRPGQPSSQYRPSTAPGQYSPYVYTQPAPPPPPPHPHALRPGFTPSTTHRSDLFFSQPANPQVTMRPHYAMESGSASQYHYVNSPPNTAQGYHHPPMPRSHSLNPLQRPPTAPPAVPPVPPKPSFQPSLPPKPHGNGHDPSSAAPATRQSSTQPPPQLADSAGDELALAMALSQSEKSHTVGEKDKLSYQEEEDLARALDESMRLSKSTPLVNSHPLAGPSKEKLFRAHSYTPGQPCHYTTSFTPTSIPEVPSPIDDATTCISDDEALARSLASKLDDPSDSKRVGPVDTSGDEELARMLANEDRSPTRVKANEDFGYAAGPSKVGPAASHLDEDEALARRLAAEDELGAGSATPSYVKSSSHKKATLPSYVNSTVDDEAFARKLAAEEETVRQNQLPPSQQAGPSSPPHPMSATTSSRYSPSPSSPPSSASDTQPILPAYADVIAAGRPNVGSAPPPPHSSVEIASQSEKSRPPFRRHESHQSPPPSTHRTESNLSVPSRPPLTHSDSATSSAQSSTPSATTQVDLPTPSSDASARRPSTSSTNPPVQASPTLSSSTPSMPPAVEDPTVSPSAPNVPQLLPPVNANQFVDADLLKGVSIGFLAPSITTRPAPMQGTFPNIINLPYGRSPPLHLQAPNWRSLLKLMARLSGTRVEPTVEGMAIAKHTMHLRLIVQFVKPHHSAPDWRVVLWFKIDHPVPPGTPNAHKFTNGDVSVLPYAFTLGNIPTLLHDSDSNVSKYYVIPSTDSLPFPALPVKFPDLALYLQAALEVSRRYMSDSSSGMRKLAKMVDQCFPNSQVDAEAADDERLSGMGGLLSRVMRRGNKGRRGGGNEDTYELVTPFVADSQEWG